LGVITSLFGNVADQTKLSGFEDVRIMILQDRQQNFVPQVRIERAPVDIEPTRVGGGGTFGKDVAPPIVCAVASHVVGHDIE